jgi:hypothetical protein
MSHEKNIDSYLGALIDDIHQSLKANHLQYHSSGGKVSRAHIQARTRSIGARLKDLPVIYSGYTSEQALINKYNTGERWSVEHQYPRQVAGHDLYNWVVSMPTYTDAMIPTLIEKLRACRTINHTTKEENRRLHKYQLKGVFSTPEKAYKEANVILLQWKQGTRIKLLPDIYPHLTPYLIENNVV